MITKAFVILGLITALLTGCNQAENEKTEEKPIYEATTPFREDTAIPKEYVCQIHAIRHIEVRALERGYLQNIFVDEGQQVHQGQSMFKVMPNIYQADLLKAKAEASTMNIEYQNTKGLADQKIVSTNELALAKAKLEKAEGDLLTTLSDTSKLWVYFNVPEAEYLDYKMHKKDNDAPTKVQLKMANGLIFNQTGIIETLEADFDNTAGNIEFRATFSNPDKLLRHGETGTIIMVKPYKNALIIPQKAVFEVMDKTYVYVINKEEKLEQRLIKIEADLPQLFIIKEGLQEDDKIVLEGLRKVHPGEEVKIDLKLPEKVRSELHLYTE